MTQYWEECATKAGIKIGVETDIKTGAAACIEIKTVIFGRKESNAKKIFGKVAGKPLDV